MAGTGEPRTLAACFLPGPAMSTLRRWSVLLAAVALLSACGGGDSGHNSSAAFADEPALETDEATLDAGLVCTPFTHPDKPPVLLVHGTFTNGYEQYDWTYLPLLDERGFDVCAVTYPDRGFGDQQISAEYVVYALRKIYAQTGRKVAMIGHSQGAGMPRWALRWWPSAREATADFVLQAAPAHGTTVADPSGTGQNPLPIPEGFRQFGPGSMFIAAVNTWDETPGDVDYTAIYTTYDELVQPVTPVPTAALDWDQNNPRVSNLHLQTLCPGRFVDHVSIGTTDRLSFELALDAISHPGPASFERAGGEALCGAAAIVPDQLVSSSAVTAMLLILPKESGPPNLYLSTEEPPLKPYAQ